MCAYHASENVKLTGPIFTSVSWRIAFANCVSGFPTGHTALLRRWINVIDVDSTSQQRRVPSVFMSHTALVRSYLVHCSLLLTISVLEGSCYGGDLAVMVVVNRMTLWPAVIISAGHTWPPLSSGSVLIAARVPWQFPDAPICHNCHDPDPGPTLGQRSSRCPSVKRALCGAAWEFFIITACCVGTHRPNAVLDAGPTLTQHWLNISRLSGCFLLLPGIVMGNHMDPIIT